MVQSWRIISFVFVWISLNSFALSQPVQLPLDGYYRPGTYMPANIGTTDEFLLETDAAMNTRTHQPGIVPIFTLSASADHLQAGGQAYPIRALQPDEKLVGFTGQRDAELAKELFPDAQIVFVSLDATAPLAGAAVAWSSLDAAILDSTAPKNLADLLPTGMTIVIRSPDKPDSTWPWKHVRDAWVLRANISPAHPALLGDDAYLPTESWTPQMSSQLRQAIVLVAVLVSCLMLATGLLRPRWRLPALVVVVAISCGAIAIWRSRQPIADELVGDIQIEGEIRVVDRWTYQSAPRATEITIPMNGVVYPVFASPVHAAMMHATLDADRAAITCQLPARTTMAFVARSIDDSSDGSTNDTITQFAPLARRAYLTPGAQLSIGTNEITVHH